MMRVLFCGAWDEGDGYPRTRALRDGLRAAGAQVHECRAPALGADKQRLLRQPWRWPLLLSRAVWRRIRFGRALRAALRSHRPEVIVVPYPGHLVVGAVARRARVPVVLDLFLSAHDTAVLDRELFAPGSLPARLLRSLDRRACAAADLVLVDTPENASFVASLTGLDRARFEWLPVGDPAAPLAPCDYRVLQDGRLQLLFFGTGVPLHGLEVLTAAVAAAPSVELTLVGGTAVDRERAQRQLRSRLHLQPEFIARERLQELIDRAELVAGVFSNRDKARRVVPFKVVHALAAGRPVVTADTLAMRRIAAAGDGEDGVFLTEPGDAARLADLLETLAGARPRLAAAAMAARQLYERHFSVERTGRRFLALIDGLAGPGGERRRLQ